MTLLPPSNYRKWLIFGLVVQVIAAWFSIGYHHPDEYYQILEFCNYKLGYSTPSDLEWEFLAQCRSAVLPFLAFVISKSLIYLHLFDPITVSFILRLCMGLFTWTVSCQLIRLLLPEFSTQQGRNIFVLLSMLLWYVPYTGVRFSAENLAGLLFFQSIILLLLSDRYTAPKNTCFLLLAGLLLGIAFFIRLQMAFAILGLGVWMLFIKKYKWQTYFLMLPGALLSIALCIGIDHWFYGSFVLTPYNYYVVNVTNNIAVQWGVFPWWWYLPLFLQNAVIPISIILLLFFITGVIKKPTHLFAIVCIIFVVGHSFVAHKELRFLFPVNMAFLFLVSIGADILISRYHIRLAFINTFRVLAAMNIVLLLFKILTPAQEAFDCYRYLYDLSKKEDVVLWSLNESPYCLNGTAVNFFKPKDLDIFVAPDLSTVISALKDDKQHAVFLSKTLLSSSLLKQYELKKTYCMFPDLVLKFNINNWEERSNIWAIYQAR